MVECFKHRLDGLPRSSTQRLIPKSIKAEQVWLAALDSRVWKNGMDSLNEEFQFLRFDGSRKLARWHKRSCVTSRITAIT